MPALPQRGCRFDPARLACLNFDKSKLHSNSPDLQIHPMHARCHRRKLGCVGITLRVRLPACQRSSSALLFYCSLRQRDLPFKHLKESFSFLGLDASRHPREVHVAATHKSDYEQRQAGCQRFCLCAMQEEVFPVLFKGL